MYFTDTECLYLKWNFEEMMGIAEGPMHPKLVKKFARSFNEINRIGSSISQHRRGEKLKMTWGPENNDIFLYLP